MVFTGCLYVERVNLYDFCKRCLVFCRKIEIMTSQKPLYLKNCELVFFKLASVNYVLFVTGTENLARLWRVVSELWRRGKSGGV